MKAILCGMIMFGLFVGTAPAQDATKDATQALYKSKCQICHGPDATGSAVGKKLGVKDFHSPEVQKLPEPELLETARKGKNKMPAYAGKLTDSQLTDLIKFMRAMAK